MNGWYHILRKEIVHILRDPATLVIAMMIPVIQLTLFGFAIDFDIRDIPTSVVDQDRTRESREYIQKLEATGYLEVVAIASVSDEAAAQVRQGLSKVAVIIPPGFARESAAGRSPQVGVLIDGSDSQVALRARGAFAQPPQPLPGTPIPRINMLFNPDMKTETFVIPGLIGVILQIVAVALTSFSLVREREQGTLEQLMVSPVGKLGLMIGKVLPYAVLAFAEMVSVLVLGWAVFGVEVVGSVGVLLLLSIPFILAALSLGLLISTIATNQSQAMQMTLLVMLPSILMSGFVFPRSTMPGFLWLLSNVLPATHFIEILRGVIVRGAGPGDLWGHVVALLVIAVVLVAVSSRRFRKSIA